MAKLIKLFVIQNINIKRLIVSYNKGLYVYYVRIVYLCFLAFKIIAGTPFVQPSGCFTFDFV